jgi:hypothetical protein
MRLLLHRTRLVSLFAAVVGLGLFGTARANSGQPVILGQDNTADITTRITTTNGHGWRVSPPIATEQAPLA